MNDDVIDRFSENAKGEALGAILDVLGGLDEGTVRALLRRAQGGTLKECGEAIGRSKENVRQRLYRVDQSLRHQIAERVTRMLSQAPPQDPAVSGVVSEAELTRSVASVLPQQHVYGRPLMITIGEAVTWTERDLLRGYAIGRRGLKFLKEHLASLGLSLGMRHRPQSLVVPCLGTDSCD